MKGRSRPGLHVILGDSAAGVFTRVFHPGDRLVIDLDVLSAGRHPWWDFALLSEVRSRGPRAARVIGYTMGDAYDDSDLVGDVYLFGRLLRLGDSRLPSPLLATAGDRTKMREVEVTLTPFGLDVLDGKASNYPTNPIEDWAGGVRLSSEGGALWFNDRGALIKTRI